MKSLRNITFLFLLLQVMVIGLSAQTKYSSKNETVLKVTGTSTMHDWEMKATEGDCQAMVNLDAVGKITSLSNISFSVLAKSLKSGKGPMDKNAYKALKTDKNTKISATMSNATITTADNKNYVVKGTMKLTIAGKTVDAPITANLKKINDTSISVKGEQTISMKTYGMEPPSFMLGAVTTGDVVVVHFDIILHQ